MTGYLHAIQVATLSTWLSVAGFGTVGVVIREKEPQPPSPVVRETEWFSEDFTLGDEKSEAAGGGVAEPMPSESLAVDPLPSPPVMPQLAETEPLPELPELPELPPVEAGPKQTPLAESSSVAAAPRSSARSSGKPSGSSGRESSRSGGSSRSGSGGSGMSNAARIAAGHMPSPSYPPYSRRNRQEGTVVVEFTVDSSGRVISARAKNPSQWHLLNSEAVSTVRSWRFPPGGVMTLQRPIVFQLR